MNFKHYNLSNCHEAEGLVVVIDVLRAFSAEAYAFHGGVPEIILTDKVESAWDLKKEFPSALLMGEINGYKIDGFDIGNSPSELSKMNLAGLTLIHRTTAGTQGVVRSKKADEIFVTGLLTAKATVEAILKMGISEISFVVTDGDEDLVCAEYMEVLFDGKSISPSEIAARVTKSKHGKRFLQEAKDLPFDDLGLCLDVDRFDFTMRVFKKDEKLFVRACQP